jgi:hypothetical protein
LENSKQIPKSSIAKPCIASPIPNKILKASDPLLEAEVADWRIQNKYQNHPSTNIALPISNKILKANDLLLEAEFAERRILTKSIWSL